MAIVGRRFVYGKFQDEIKYYTCMLGLKIIQFIIFVKPQSKSEEEILRQMTALEANVVKADAVALQILEEFNKIWDSILKHQ